MNGRTRSKLRNIRMFFTKNVWSSRYIVRNTLVVTLALTALALIAGVGVYAVQAYKNAAPKKQEPVIAQVEEAPVVITYAQAPTLDRTSVEGLKVAMENGAKADIAANETLMVAGTGSDFDTKAVANADDVNIYAKAADDAELVGKMDTGAVCKVLTKKGGWLKISSGDVEGYVDEKLVIQGEKAKKLAQDYFSAKGTVNTDGVCIRTEASTSADQVMMANKEDSFTVNKEASTDKWICVVIEETGGEAYVYADYIDVKESYLEAYSVETEEVQEKKEESETEEETTAEDETEADTEQEEETTTESETTTEAATTEETTTEATTTEETTTESTTPVATDDFNLLCAVVYCESGAESYEGQLAVANVILNRVKSSAYGNTISEVVYAPYQFAVVGSEKFNSLLAGGAPETTVAACQAALAGTNNVGNCIGFRPTWNIDTSTLSFYIQIGNHIFF